MRNRRTHHSIYVWMLAAFLIIAALYGLIADIAAHLWMLALIAAIPSAYALGWYRARQSANASLRRSPERTEPTDFKLRLNSLYGKQPTQHIDQSPPVADCLIPDDGHEHSESTDSDINRLLSDPRSGARRIGDD